MLEGLEYLTVMNGFENVMKMVYRVIEATVRNGRTAMVTLNLDAFGERERALLGDELRALDGEV